MQIVIPMSGFGERFRAAGYTIPKPLIEVEGKPIIQHVVEMFSNEDDFIFICNEDHLLNPEYKMKAILQDIALNSSIVSIKPHKLGPVYAVMQVLD
jgi:NDP-sugar pyrophosphorylase family protein